ncbi:MAG: flagellar biosynthesis protein FlhB [Candidatus Cloacimonadales bacterium]|nr:flagellar biosynthesis protein FlhB [Candidatus Cloacimonadota bacterium]MDX9977749.1 flagellar biosynthesis protein FlhB [Candidatus Cloacimonadales bacterium]
MADETEKTEQPTSKRLSDARKKGDVARSSEIDTAIYLLMLLLILKVGGPYILHVLKELFIQSFTNLNKRLDNVSTQTIAIKYMLYYWLIIGPIGLALMISGTIASIVQVGWLVTTDKLKWNFDIFKMDGLKQVFSAEGFKKLAKGLVKLGVLTLIIWLVIRKEIEHFMGLSFLDINQIFTYMLKILVKIIIYLLIFYIFFAVIDYVWSKFLFMKKLKMTKSEVKDEFKQMEGDPQVKQKILRLMMEESIKRMMGDVPQADVVITNPTHLAIAIKYDPEISDAPIVLAKGKRLIAERIKDIAKENDIPIVEDKPLARLLYKHSDIGKPIDVQFYAAVAEILAAIYRAKDNSNKQN